MATPVAVLYCSVSAWQVYEYLRAPLPLGADSESIPMDLRIYLLNDDGSYTLYNTATFRVARGVDESGPVQVQGLGMYGFGGYAYGYPDGTKSPIIPPTADYPNGSEGEPQLAWFGWSPSLQKDAMYLSAADLSSDTGPIPLPSPNAPPFDTMFSFTGPDGQWYEPPYFMFEPLRGTPSNSFWTDFVDTYEEI